MFGLLFLPKVNTYQSMSIHRSDHCTITCMRTHSLFHVCVGMGMRQPVQIGICRFICVYDNTYTTGEHQVGVYLKCCMHYFHMLGSGNVSA